MQEVTLFDLLDNFISHPYSVSTPWDLIDVHVFNFFYFLTIFLLVPLTRLVPTKVKGAIKRLQK